MARQTSIITLNGKVGGLSFYKTKDGYFAREKGGVSKSRIMTDPKFARTRENLQEFAEAASAVKLIKDTLRPAIIRSSDSRLHGRLQNALLKMVKSDPINSRGERKAIEGEWEMLQDLELNKNAGFTSTMRSEFSIVNTAASFTVNLPELNPADYLVYPVGTTHFRIFAYGASVALGGKDRSLTKADTDLMSVSASMPATSLVVNKAELLEDNKLFILGIEFIQEVNGVEYFMNNGAHNAAVVLLTESPA